MESESVYWVKLFSSHFMHARENTGNAFYQMKVWSHETFRFNNNDLLPVQPLSINNIFRRFLATNKRKTDLVFFLQSKPKCVI
jgi:hypothetical protein